MDAVQPTLPLADRAGARPADPDTSHQAAASVNAGLSRAQDAVLRVLRRTGPATDERLVGAYEGWYDADHREGVPAHLLMRVPRQSPSGIRTRRRELADAGLVRDTGERGRTASGRACIIWAAV